MDARKVVIEPSIDQSKDPKDYGAKVSYEGMECEVRKLENPLARRYNALQQIVGDLQDILGFIEKYNSSEVLIRSAIFQAIIISYGRCFGSGDARGISLREQDVFPEGSPLLQTHRDLIRIRHKVVAHADDPDVTCGEISIVLPPHGTLGLNPVLLAVTRNIGCYTPEQMSQVTPLVRFVQEYAKRERQNCSASIINRA